MDFLAGLIIGVYGGLAAERWLHLSERALRLLSNSPITRYEFRPGVVLAPDPPPLDHAERWARWSVRWILFSEMVSRETGKPTGQLPSRRDYEKRGVSWRTADAYNEPLSHAGIVEIRGRAGVYWAVDWRARRVLARRMTYPPSPPPRFDFHA